MARTTIATLAAVAAGACLSEPQRAPAAAADATLPDVATDVGRTDATDATRSDVAEQDLGPMDASQDTSDDGDSQMMAADTPADMPPLGQFVTGVQYFSVSLTGTSQTVMVDPFDPDKTVPFITTSVSDNVVGVADEFVQVAITNSGEVTLLRGNSSGTVTVEVELVEFGPGATVHKGGFGLEDGVPSLTRTVTPYDPDHSFAVFWNSSSSNSNVKNEALLGLDASGGDALRLSRGSTGGQVAGSWWIVESPWINVDHVALSWSANVATVMVMGVSATKSIALLSVTSTETSSRPETMFVDCVPGERRVVCNRAVSDRALDLHLQVVTFVGATTVSQNLLAFPTGMTSSMLPVAPATGVRSVVGGSLGLAGVGRASGTHLTSSHIRASLAGNQLHGARGASQHAAESSVSVVDWND